MAIIDCELLSLQFNNLVKMEVDFPDDYKDILTLASTKFKNALLAKLHASEMCEAIRDKALDEHHKEDSYDKDCDRPKPKKSTYKDIPLIDFEALSKDVEDNDSISNASPPNTNVTDAKLAKSFKLLLKQANTPKNACEHKKIDKNNFLTQPKLALDRPNTQMQKKIL